MATGQRTTATVIDTDELVKRNAEFAAGRPFAGLSLLPSGSLQVIGCVDPRVDPAHVLGLKLGEAAVIRNVGGRVTPATLRTLAMLANVVQANSDGRPRGDFHYAVLQHTVDVEILRQALPGGVFVSGLVYDVATGLIDAVVPPARV